MLLVIGEGTEEHHIPNMFVHLPAFLEFCLVNIEYLKRCKIVMFTVPFEIYLNLKFCISSSVSVDLCALWSARSYKMFGGQA